MSEEPNAVRGPVRGWVQHNIARTFLLVLVVVVTVVMSVTWVSRQGEITAQEDRISQLEADLQQQERINAEQVEANVLEGLGMDQGRVARDSTQLEQLAEAIFTWDSGKTYEQARTTVKDRFDLTEDDEFMQTFMPPSRYNEDSSGQRHYYIDAAGVNSSVADVNSSVVEVSAGDYTYAVTVQVQVGSDAVSGSNIPNVTRSALLFVTMDAEGEITDLSGVPASNSTRTSA